MGGDELMTSADLVALLARTCAAAVQHRDHPWRKWLGSERPAQQLDSLKRWRNDNSHLDDRRSRDAPRTDPLERIRDVLDLVEYSLPHLPTESIR
jgi:hypothetical protein